MIHNSNRSGSAPSARDRDLRDKHVSDLRSGRAQEHEDEDRPIVVRGTSRLLVQHGRLVVERKAG